MGEPSELTRSCSSCGATVVFPVSGISTACSYCGSRLVESGRAASEVDAVAPFRIPKAAAEDRLREHLADAWWAPEAIRRGAKKGTLRAGALRGVLVPFFAYTAKLDTTYSARIGVHWYRREKVASKDKASDPPPATDWATRFGGVKTRRRKGSDTRMVQETEWFDLEGSALGYYEDHLVPATAGLPDREIRRLGAFDLGRCVAFDPRVVAGWEAELPSVRRTATDDTAEDQLRELEIQRLHQRLLPGDKQRLIDVRCRVDVQRVRLVLVPIWIATYRGAGSVYRLMVHGQTGKCTGRPPVSTAKVSLAAAAVAIIGLVILWVWGVLPWPR